MSGSANSSQLSDILNSEQARLTQKKQQIDDAINGQNRLIQFNDSYNQRYIYYLKIMIIIVFTLVLFFGLKYIGENVDFVPSWIIDLTNVVIFSLAFFGIYYTTSDILRRDNMDFNEVKAPAPLILSAEEVNARQAAAAASGDLLGTISQSTCGGISCCGSDTMWDPSSNLCHMPGFKSSESTVQGPKMAAPLPTIASRSGPITSNSSTSRPITSNSYTSGPITSNSSTSRPMVSSTSGPMVSSTSGPTIKNSPTPTR